MGGEFRCALGRADTALTMSNPERILDDHSAEPERLPHASMLQLQTRAPKVPAVEWLPDRPRSRYRLRASLTMLAGLAWLTYSVIVTQVWWGELRASLGMVLGTVAIMGIAWLPGYLYAQLLASVLLDRRTPLPDGIELPAMTVVVAVFNEEETLAATIERLVASEYPGVLKILIADDGSVDDTLGAAAELVERYDNVFVLACEHGGKHNALNTALNTIDTPLVTTVDADTLVEPGALRRVAARLIGTDGCVAVAGSLLVANDDETLMTRMQSWEYRLSIAAIKRQQAMFGGTMVAQGAFSVYATRQVLAVGGWPDAVGEDILVTWQLLQAGGQVEFEPTAFARTDVPLTIRTLGRQRRRWARGMIEGLRENGAPMLRMPRLVVHGVLVDYILPIIDFAYLMIFIPGLIAAVFFHNYMVVGPLTFAVLPMALLLFAAMGRAGRMSRREAGVTLERHWSGFAAYMTIYRTILAAASLHGYWQELRRTKREW